ncbi:peptidoglycan-binding protein [Prauserella muralis]|uniref:Peptidoglycan-binding protein n=1 Tax=Prauserella muralis TaxID=588067 RepID=A0A2V4BBN7_9PSEU|nr:peptidoglycan-binding protein [Prauserella muralis]
MAATVTGLAALAAVPAAASDSPGSGPADATVDMAAVLRAAQIDPQRPDQTMTPGAGASVTAVEQALRAKGLLGPQYVDGHFGTRTVAAYADHQHSLGYAGLAANGLPGEESLRRLGEGRFDVTHVVRPGTRTTHTGKVVNARTKAMLVEAQRLLGRTLVVDQGSYNPGGDPTSAGTHDGGGAVDINVDDMTTATRTKVVTALRKVGFAAWHRTPDQGDWPHHIHAIALGDPDLSSPAQHQAGDYYLGRNGLANEAPDDGPEVKPIRTWEQYQRTR